ncbi:hypothetical protein A2303_07245 [Candidatus Falkowbacteria bacterium RIFOXYB2_FULL_47_14]|uniref:Uncharacterized protein n=1 Tax=Candidatus Falkowbacteria bacterium RIFOXYA2_FULL_47_19 TaxID=1797994 RepID=A0A1F5SHM0_9BACT|nr:MAG: hypothetical protein A2227_00990 [Candidatus Falkowbacteria bacterium RIFOXYA2_FULL_47_19]OGF34943.1 MAG: hypothetical protein A2468_06950 [Candidatus Falkowbacteria bacterium RIFOXYC2_FULL_46_15]OGF43658.1 MAG: hypothetical protein A2303_07245 [Candidatus Falkowbacteria bacterium RIFOXYB2_FULL_47_14]
MSKEKLGGFTESPKPKKEKISRPGEKLKGFRAELWQRAKSVLTRLGFDLSARETVGLEKETVKKIKEIRNRNEEDKFLDLELERGGENLRLRFIGQVDTKYDPDREKDYATWDLTPREEAERWLNREILVGEKINKFFSAGTISADSLVEYNRSRRVGEMFLLKKIKSAEKETEEYGEAEGRLLGQTLINLQTGLNATAMIKEIMVENGIKTKLEMEQRIFEDYFDNFDGYMDNSRVILGDLNNEDIKENLEAQMEKYRETIEAGQLNKDEYAFVHGDVNLETARLSAGKMYLSDWRLSGKTQNRELAIVYDLGNAFNSAIENFDTAAQAEEFIRGAEKAVREHYKDQSTAEAVIRLAKLRSFAMILNDLKGEKKDFVRQELGI